MILHYVASLAGVLRRHAWNYAASVVGLGVAMSAACVIALIVAGELGYDAWAPRGDDIARVETVSDPSNGRSLALTSGRLRDVLVSDFDEVDAAVRLRFGRMNLRVGEDLFSESITFVDPGFFDMFPFPTVSGDPAGAEDDTTSLALRRDVAARLFGDADPTGRTLTVCCFGDATVDMRVAGVYGRPPGRSHFDIGAIARLEPSRYDSQPWVLQMWGSTNVFTYLRLKPGARDISGDLPAFLDRHDPARSEPGGEAERNQLRLVGLRDIHLGSQSPVDMTASGDPRLLIVFVLIAVLILAMAAFNFATMNSALASLRTREAAVRRIFGATRRNVIAQRMFEGAVVAFAAYAVAVAITAAAAPEVLALFEMDAPLGASELGAFAAVGAVVAMGFGAVSSLIPALGAVTRPASDTARTRAGVGERKGAGLRALLIGLQAVAAMSLATFTVAATMGLRAQLNQDLGYDLDHLITAPRPSGVSDDAWRGFKTRLEQLPGVTAVTGVTEVPGASGGTSTRVASVNGAPAGDRLVYWWSTDADFLDVFRARLIAGRMLTFDRAQDVLRIDEDAPARLTYRVVLNETAVAALGLGSPDDAIGARFVHPLDYGSTGEAEVVGVVADFRTASMHQPQLPYVLRLEPRTFNDVVLRHADAAPPRPRPPAPRRRTRSRRSCGDSGGARRPTPSCAGGACPTFGTPTTPRTAAGRPRSACSPPSPWRSPASASPA